MEHYRVLIVDDDEAIRRLLGRYLRHLGYEVEVAAGTVEAIQHIEHVFFDVVLTDVRMPGADGMQLLDWIASHRPDTAVVMLSGCDDVRQAVRAMKSGAQDYIVKPFELKNFSETLGRAIGKQKEMRSQARYLADLESTLEQQSGELRTTVHALQEASQETLEALVTALDARERETQAHSQRVSDFSVYLARAMNVQEVDLENIRKGSMLHDIGKIGIPDRILLKPERLTQEEWVEMRKHPEIGAWIVNGVESLRSASDIVITHHERYDGGGYPKGLRREEIPLGSRIFAVADTLDAILSDRPYRAGQSYQQAREEIERGASSQFDPHVAACFLDTPCQVWNEIREHSLAKPNPALVGK